MAQRSDYEVLTDKKTKATVYRGECTFDDLMNRASFSWLAQGAAEYRPDTARISFLRKHLPAYHIVIFMGTWCDDTYNLLPKLYKVITATNFPMGNYTMYGVDRNKVTKNIEHKLYKIENVPTFIISRGNTEIGRITENTKKSIETDLAVIIDQDLKKQELREQMEAK